MELGIEEAGSKKFRMLYMEKEEREKFYKEQEETAKQKKWLNWKSRQKKHTSIFGNCSRRKQQKRFLENRFTFLFLSKRSLYKSNGSVPKKYLEKVGWKLPKAAIWEYLKLLLNLGKKKG